MTHNDILWILILCGFMAYLALGAFITDVILPKFPKLQRTLDKIFDIKE